MSQAEVTQYGFKFGAAEYTRACSQSGYTWVLVKTPRQQLEICVTPTGFIRVGEPHKYVTTDERK